MPSATAVRRAFALAALAALLCSQAYAFPGFIVQKGVEPSGVVHTTHAALMVHGGFVVTTIMADYEGSLDAFALVLPVPADVTEAGVKTVKREIVSRLEQVSAPRFHTFYEKDPCDVGPTEQQWDERVRATGRGFLTPRMLPPADDRYEVSNELSVPDAPVFKGAESEFRYRVITPKTSDQAKDWFALHGYRARETVFPALAPYLARGMRLLVADVLPDRVELLGQDHVQLAGIRYVSRVATEDDKGAIVTLPSALGLSASAGSQDLFIYVLHRERRFEAKNFTNVFPPTNVAFDPEAQSEVGPLYDQIFQRLIAAHPDSFVTEFAWTTEGCGQPCANAPLMLRELLSLGGDVLEKRTLSAAERAAKVPPLGEKESSELATMLARLPPSERAAKRRDFERTRRELSRRRALVARQTYVLSRLHYRYGPSLSKDVAVGPAPAHVAGGTGVPRGLHATLPRAIQPAATSHMQVRFVAVRPWVRPMPCVKKERFRWGKRWDSERAALRKVWLALDTPRARRDPGLLERTLREPLPELGLEVSAVPAPSASGKTGAPTVSRAARGKAASQERREERCACSVAGLGSGTPAPAVPAELGILLVLSFARRRRARTGRAARSR